VYRVLAATPGYTPESGRTPIGNYDLPRRLVDGAKWDLIPCEPGDWVITQSLPSRGDDLQRSSAAFYRRRSRRVAA
jgi:hypothetical protein